jgi:glycosyltransferase involved in cell wall biosynthesis
MAATTVSVIVPVFNEERTVVPILEEVARQRVDGVAFEVVVVDDGSSDGTAERLLARPDLYHRLVRRPINGGKGAAVRDGLKAAAGDFVLFQDADLEYHPSDYATLLAPVLDFGADLVVGSRFLAPRFTRVFYFWHQVGNRFITLFFNLLNNTTFSDIYTCYVLFRRRLVDPDELRADGWAQQAEILSLIVHRGAVFYQVPVAYSGRTYGEGKKIKWYHVGAVIGMILRRRLSF